LGFLSDLHGILIHFGLAVTMTAPRVPRNAIGYPLHKSARIA